MNSRTIRVFAPATVANIGCGFDVFGLALEQPGDNLELTVTAEPGITIKNTPDIPKVPTDPAKNTAGKALSAVLSHFRIKTGVVVKFIKKLPVKSGLGSSAASAIAAVFAINHLLDLNLSPPEILTFAIEGEKISSGPDAHLDNLAACLYGGFVVVRNQDPGCVITVPVPADLHCIIHHPHLEVATIKARKIIPAEIPTKKAILQWGNTAALISALYQSDYHLIRECVQDYIAEPLRSDKIPHFEKLREAALYAGAAGFGISGSGPSVFALAQGQQTADYIASTMGCFYKKTGIPFTIYQSAVNKKGTYISTE